MKTGTLLKSVLLVAGLLCATGFQAVAQGAGGAGGGGRGGMAVLTTEQRQKMRDTIQADLTPLTEKLTAAQKDAAKAVLSNASDDAIKAKLDAVNKIQADIALLRAKGVKAIASSLTADQKEQLENARDGGYTALLGGGGMFAGRGGAGGRRSGNQ